MAALAFTPFSTGAQQAENKRKAGSGTQDAAAAPRKAPKVGETPGKVQAAAKGRAWAASPSRFKQNASSSLLASKVWLSQP